MSHQGPGRAPGAFRVPSLDACHICGEQCEAHSILTQARATLPFQEAQPPWVHPLGRPTPQEKQMVLGLPGTGCPGAQLLHRCGGEGRMGERQEPSAAQV